MKRTIRALVIVAAVLCTACSRPPLTVELDDGSQFPIGRQLWPAPGNVERQLKEAGLPNVKGQGEDYHLHVHLQVFRNGAQVMVPANVGVTEEFLSPLHTHENRGVIHVESPVVTSFTLGQFFKLWDVSLDGAKLIANGVEVPDAASHVFSDADLLTVYWGSPPQ